MNLHTINFRSKLLGFYLDNIIYRHEIGMDSYGKLRRGSPIVAAHLVMGSVTALTALTFLLEGWAGLTAGTLGVMAILAVLAYPIAYRRGFFSIERERSGGTLEQLFLTSLTQVELFDGKFFGSLAPFLEVRRYLMMLTLMGLCGTYMMGMRDLLPPLAACYMILINHFGYSAYLGTLAGLKGASRGSNLGYEMMRQWELNPWLKHIEYILGRKYTYYLLALSFGLTLFAGGFYVGTFPIGTWAAGAVLMLIPIYSANFMEAHQRDERDRASRSFRKNIRFDVAR